MNRASWKIYYRMLRIHRREAAKAFNDMVTFGSGYLDMSDPEPRHVPLTEIFP